MKNCITLQIILSTAIFLVKGCNYRKDEVILKTGLHFPISVSNVHNISIWQQNHKNENSENRRLLTKKEITKVIALLNKGIITSKVTSPTYLAKADFIGKPLDMFIGLEDNETLYIHTFDDWIAISTSIAEYHLEQKDFIVYIRKLEQI